MFISLRNHARIVTEIREECRAEIRVLLERISELSKCPENEWKRQMEYYKQHADDIISRRKVIEEDYRILQIKYDEIYKVLNAKGGNFGVDNLHDG